MKDTQDKIGYCQLSLGLLYEDSTEYDNNGEVYPVSKQEILLNAKLNKKKNKENSQNKRKSLIKVNE